MLEKHDLNLWQKLAAISKEIGHIEKTGKNSHFNYAFIEHSQIVAAGREIMEEYGVTIDLEALDATWDEAKNTRVLLHMNYTVTNADKPSETFTRRWVSEAMDQQDKGINKALTAAEKNVFMKLFHISDVDLEADENDIVQPKKSAPAPRQQPATQATRPVATQNAPAQDNRIPNAYIPPSQPVAARPASTPAQARPVTQPAPSPNVVANPTAGPELATDMQKAAITKMAQNNGWDAIELRQRLFDLYGYPLDTLPKTDAGHFIKVLQDKARA